MNDPLDPIDADGPLDPELEDRLRAHFADRADREPLPGDGVVPPSLPATRSWWQRPPMLAAAAALLVVALVGALALRDDDPEELETVEESTTTTDAPSTTTTETTVLETTTTSVPATTTTTVPPGSDVRSVIVSVDGVLGWWDGTRFVRWDEGGDVPLSGGEEYVLVGLTRSSTAVGSAPRTDCAFSEPYPTFVDIPGLDPSAVLEPVPVAVTGVPDPALRPVEEIGAGPYVAAAAESLAQLGIDDPAPDLVQVLRTDFEGDGIDEVLFVAERLSDPQTLLAELGDYSVVLLRQVIDGEVRTSVLHESYADDLQGGPFVSVGRVAAAADLNGDGTMELVIRQREYEGGGSRVFAVDRVFGGAGVVLETWCGV